MPVFSLKCPTCGHVFLGMVLAGTNPPEQWVCSRCHDTRAEPVPEVDPEPHPWETDHGGGKCNCCG